MSSPFEAERIRTLLIKFQQVIRNETPNNIHLFRTVLANSGVSESTINSMMLQALSEMIFEYETPEFDIEYHHTDCDCPVCNERIERVKKEDHEKDLIRY